MASEFEVKRDIVEVGRRIYNKGFVAANDGNISVRISDDVVLTTPTGVSKGFMTPDMIIKVDMDGRVISGSLKPSSELKMHLAVYREREDVKSVVHAHPPTATAFAVAGIPIKTPIMPEVVISLGWVPIAEYGTPSTDEIPKAVSKYLQCHDAFLLENHGALTVGIDVFNAHFKMETLEHGAQISLAARLLGGEKEISAENVEKLMDVRRKLGVPGRHPAVTSGCEDSCAKTEGRPSSVAPSSMNERDLVELITRVTMQVLAEQKSR